jgi:signal transduction histidine kinase/Fe-S-cluster-containing hydrogenase component 2
MCYTCVRECPAKAIRIVDGQAEVVAERCIACGNCVRVCSQGAKEVLSSVEQVRAILQGAEPVAACLAPSFPAEFTDVEPEALVGMVRRLGFRSVHEVSFGADLVAQAYRELLSSHDEQRFVATTCPAVVAYVERYHPGLVDRLAPIVSPMVALARALKHLKGAEWRVVFIGPCIAKKYEAESRHLPDEVDAALTFRELRQLLEEEGVSAEGAGGGDFDPPHGGSGGLFSVSRGILQAAEIPEDLLAGEVVAADGRTDFVDAIREFDDGDLDARLLETLACRGCIMGAGMTSDEPLFGRRARVSRYVRSTMQERGQEQWAADMGACADLDLSRAFAPLDQRIAQPSEAELKEILGRLGKIEPQDELNCGACGYETCREHAIAIFKGLAENEMCLPYAIDELKRTINELAESHEALQNAQEALSHNEKLASMGQLAAGIAHELNNPLGVVLMYAHLLREDERIDAEVREDATLIAEEADRCKRIVSGLLHFARQNKVIRQEVRVNDLVDRSLRACAIPRNITVDRQNELGDDAAMLDGDQVQQTLINLINNACAAMEDGGTLTLATAGTNGKVTIRVADTGTGIAEENRKRIFDPFFTTKQIGAGTGLGLAVTYGIVKMHHGSIDVDSNADPEAGPTGTSFTIHLPKKEGETVP